VNTYKKLCTEFYDLDKPEPPEDALTFYLRLAERANGPILEPMCGSGRFLIPLLKRGFDIEGVDASSHMLEACHASCKKKALTPVLYEQSVEQMDLARQYGLVFIPAGSFCLITELQQAKECLKRIYEFMLPHAKFVLEVETPRAQPVHAGQWGGRWVERPDGSKILLSWLSLYDEKEQICRAINRYELFKAETLLETEFEEFTLRFYEPAEFRGLLETAGFENIRLLKPYQSGEPDGGDPSIVFECSKPASWRDIE
jgi:ubiquinone/menaquinone biosynthesis C-methylase UbiE